MRLKNKKTGEIADIEINSHHLTIVYEDGRVDTEKLECQNNDYGTIRLEGGEE